MIQEILILAAITLIPALELRASIPYGIFATDLHWTLVFIVCVITNIILGPVVYFIIDKVLHIFLKIKALNDLWQKIIARAQKKIHKHVEKWGWLGVAVFIGIPLPGSGSYTGAVGSYLLGLGYKKFFLANLIGVLIAGLLVTIIVLTGAQAFDFFIKTI